MTVVKIFWGLLLLGVALQDSIEKKVYLFFFPLLLATGFFLQWKHWDLNSLLLFGGINSAIILAAVALLWGYAQWRKIPFLNHSMGVGDILMLVVLAWSFPPISFISIWLTTSLFSLLVFGVWLRIEKIPLAGHLAFFVALLSLIDAFFDPSLLYSKIMI